MLSLEGVTVVGLEQAVAAPLATRQLADLGARVIKVERPDVGDFARGYDASVRGLSSHFVWLNRSKQSLALDLKRPEARAVLERLLASADVFVHNLAPGAVDRLGFPADCLRRQYPRLISCGISGYGSSGPYRDRRAYDLLLQCEAGLLSITGTPETPSKSGISIADIAAGMYAFSGVLNALYVRERTGQGASFEISMLEALGEWMGYPAYYAAYGGSAPPRTGASHATIAPYGPFATGDGKAVFLGIQNEREWARFCAEILEQPHLADEARFASNAARIANQGELCDLIEAAFQAWTAEEAIDRLEAVQIANARLNTIQEFWDHPQLAARGRWGEVDSPVGRLRMLLPPLAGGEWESRMGRIPAVGEHTEEILRELGVEPREREALGRGDGH